MGEESDVIDMETHDDESFLGSGRQLLTQATEVYGRPLSAREYWWMGVALAAATLADLGGKPYAVGRLEQLIDRLGHKGASGDWTQRMVDELAELDAQGLLWPVYEQSSEGRMAETGLELHPDFGGEQAYFLALAHIGVAVALTREESATVEELAGAIANIVESGSAAAHEERILRSLNHPDAP